MSAASNAFRRSGRASVTWRTSAVAVDVQAGFSHLGVVLGGKLREHRLDLTKDIGLVVAEVVEIRVEGGEHEPQLVLRQFDRVHGGTLTDPSCRERGDGRAAAAVPDEEPTTRASSGR